MLYQIVTLFIYNKFIGMTTADEKGQALLSIISLSRSNINKYMNLTVNAKQIYRWNYYSSLHNYINNRKIKMTVNRISNYNKGSLYCNLSLSSGSKRVHINRHWNFVAIIVVIIHDIQKASQII